jgi:hypothetical protein
MMPAIIKVIKNASKSPRIRLLPKELETIIRTPTIAVRLAIKTVRVGFSLINIHDKAAATKGTAA